MFADFPKVSFTSAHTGINEGQTVSLTCTVQARPEPKVTIQKVTSSEVLYSKTSSGSHRHTFSRISCLATGQYVCTAQNGIPDTGSQYSETLNLNVLCTYIGRWGYAYSSWHRRLSLKCHGYMLTAKYVYFFSKPEILAWNKISYQL